MNNVKFNDVKLLVDLPSLAIPLSSGVELASLVDVIFLNGCNLSTTELISQLSHSPVKHWMVPGLYGFIIVLALSHRMWCKFT